MAGTLRASAVTVEELEIGSFVWVLLEQGLEWEQPSRAKHPTKSYANAMASGLLALEGLIDDLEIGSRKPEVERLGPKRAAFGFGFGGMK